MLPDFLKIVLNNILISFLSLMDNVQEMYFLDLCFGVAPLKVGITMITKDYTEALNHVYAASF